MLDLLVAATTTTGIKNPLPETRELSIYPEFVNICYKNADDTLGGWDNLETHQKLMVEANCFCKYYYLNTGERSSSGNTSAVCTSRSKMSSGI